MHTHTHSCTHTYSCTHMHTPAVSPVRSSWSGHREMPQRLEGNLRLQRRARNAVTPPFIRFPPTPNCALQENPKKSIPNGPNACMHTSRSSCCLIPSQVHNTTQSNHTQPLLSPCREQHLTYVCWGEVAGGVLRLILNVERGAG